MLSSKTAIAPSPTRPPAMRRDSRWRSCGRPSAVPVPAAGSAAPRRGPTAARASRCIHAGGRIGLMKWSEPRRRALGGSAPLPVARPDVGLQDALAQPEARGRDLEELVLADPLERLLERHAVGGQELDALLRRRGPHVRQLLLLDDVDVHVL